MAAKPQAPEGPSSSKEGIEEWVRIQPTASTQLEYFFNTRTKVRSAARLPLRTCTQSALHLHRKWHGKSQDEVLVLNSSFKSGKASKKVHPVPGRRPTCCLRASAVCTAWSGALALHIPWR